MTKKGVVEVLTKRLREERRRQKGAHLTGNFLWSSDTAKIKYRRDKLLSLPEMNVSRLLDLYTSILISQINILIVIDEKS